MNSSFVATDPFCNVFDLPHIFDPSIGLSHKLNINGEDDGKDADLFRKRICYPDDLKFQEITDHKNNNEVKEFRSCPLHSDKVISTLSTSPQFDQLYFVHYVTNDNTLQGISLKYDCPMQYIKKINRIHSISHFGDIRIRKLVLVPLKYVGEKLKNLTVYEPPHPHKTINNEYSDDMEEFLEESFSDYQKQSLQDENHDFTCLPGSAISRSVWNDLSSEFKSLSTELKGCLDNYLYGFSFLDTSLEEQTKVPTFIIEVPLPILTNLTNTSFGKKSPSSLPTPKPSLEEDDDKTVDDKDLVSSDIQYDSQNGFNSFLYYLLNICGVSTYDNSKDKIVCEIELNSFQTI